MNKQNQHMIVRQMGPIHLALQKGLASQAGFSDFCAPAGTIEFNAHGGFLGNNIKLFEFKYSDFTFEAVIDDCTIFVRRNGLYQHSEKAPNPADSWRVAIQWDKESIGCGIRKLDSPGGMDDHMRLVRTPLTIPPTEIIQVLRQNNLLTNEKYKTTDDFFISLIDSFNFTQRDIQRFGNEEVFWEEKTGSKVPIREPKITRLIGSFLVGEGATRNFDVTIETAAGGGIVDFYVAAPVEGVGIAKIAVEAKKAESSDLVRGLSKQLPDYMNKIGTRYGIYVVYWLKSFDYPKPHFESYAKLETEKLHPIKRAEQIRTLCLDLSRDTKPSKR